jgi:hypothetical protein
MPVLLSRFGFCLATKFNERKAAAPEVTKEVIGKFLGIDGPEPAHIELDRAQRP